MSHVHRVSHATGIGAVFAILDQGVDVGKVHVTRMELCGIAGEPLISNELAEPGSGLKDSLLNRGYVESDDTVTFSRCQGFVFL